MYCALKRGIIKKSLMALIFMDHLTDDTIYRDKRWSANFSN